MSERIFYCICADNCKFETLTKEQIIAAIAEATGNTPTDVDAAFITKIKEQNANKPVKIWVGTQAEFNAITEKDPETLYYYDDTTESDLAAAIENILNGTTPVAEAEHATEATKDGDGNTISETYYKKTDTVANATNATKANKADKATYFVGSDWISVSAQSGYEASQLEKGATYQILVTDGDSTIDIISGIFTLSFSNSPNIISIPLPTSYYSSFTRKWYGEIAPLNIGIAHLYVYKKDDNDDSVKVDFKIRRIA